MRLITETLTKHGVLTQRSVDAHVMLFDVCDARPYARLGSQYNNSLFPNPPEGRNDPSI